MHTLTQAIFKITVGIRACTFIFIAQTSFQDHGRHIQSSTFCCANRSQDHGRFLAQIQAHTFIEHTSLEIAVGCECGTFTLFEFVRQPIVERDSKNPCPALLHVAPLPESDLWSKFLPSDMDSDHNVSKRRWECVKGSGVMCRCSVCCFEVCTACFVVLCRACSGVLWWCTCFCLCELFLLFFFQCSPAAVQTLRVPSPAWGTLNPALRVLAFLLTP